MTGKAVRQQKSARQIGIWPLEERPGFLIRRLHQIHVALFQEKCAAFDVTPLQYSLLTALAQCGTADQTTLAAEVCSIAPPPPAR
jgi:MarR family transcriptional regulator, lower aerobic nicotinate degradation pathway regulator